jgi:tetratricopeptide (TPR) repeat protein
VNPFWTRKSAGLLVVAVAVFVYAPTLVLMTVQYDDHWLWSATSPLRSFDANMLRDVFFEFDAKARRPLGGEYLPVRDIAVAIDMAIWGDNERGPHATQLLLFALTVWSLGGMLKRWGVPPAIAWFGTLIWAVHPIHVESVAWLSERKGVLAALFVVACGHAWIRYRKDGAWWWIVVAAGSAILGTWSKAPAMFAPAVFAAWDLLLLPAARRRWIAIAAVGLAAAFAAAPVITVARDARVIDEARATQPGKLESAVGAQGHYVQSMVVAKQPSIAYPTQTDGPSFADLALGVLAIAGSIAVVGLRKRFASPWPLALLAWAWIWFVPISHLAVRVHILVADRFAFLWSLAGCLAVAWLVITRLAGNVRLAAGGMILCSLAVVSLRAEGAWTSSVALYTRAVESNPKDPSMREALAIALAGDGRIEEAFVIVERGLAMDPAHPYLLQRKARLLAAMGKIDEALGVAARAAESGRSSAMFTYGQMLRDTGKLADALVWAERAAKRNPLPDYVRLYGQLLLDVKRPADAAVVLEALTTPLDHLMTARAWLEAKQPDRARPHLELAAAAYPQEVASLRRRLP